LSIQEHRVFGPPGTGKTTYLTRQIKSIVEKYGWDSLLIASFTKTAAAELTGRSNPEGKCIGTLHSHALRSIGYGKELAEAHVDEFNTCFPHFRLSHGAKSVNVEDIAQGATTYQTEGDKLMYRMNLLRSRMVSYELWPENIKAFRNAWTTFKKADKLIDYTDMVEIAYNDVDCAPGSPQIAMIDEAQDLSPLMLALVRKWAEHMETLVLSGDDDQTIFTFIGSSPEVFLEGEPAEKRVLSQSYRVPAVIQAYAEKWISRVQKREAKEYKPRDYEGEIKRMSSTLKNPEQIILEVEKYISEGKKVMILAACSYMLERTIQLLRQQGIMFHNPYRVSNGAWNPIKLKTSNRKKEDKQLSTLMRLMTYLRPCAEFWGRETDVWSEAELSAWIDMVSSKENLKKGAKKLMLERQSHVITAEHILEELFLEESGFWDVWDYFTKERALNWISENMTGAATKKAQYPLSVLRKHTYEKVYAGPKLTVGTIHSVKGGEADVVVLFPDLSLSGYQEWTKGGESKDSVIRLFYVGITRARETVILCQPASSMAIQWM